MSSPLPEITMTLIDASGNVVTNYEGTISLRISSPNVSIKYAGKQEEPVYSVEKDDEGVLLLEPFYLSPIDDAAIASRLLKDDRVSSSLSIPLTFTVAHVLSSELNEEKKVFVPLNFPKTFDLLVCAGAPHRLTLLPTKQIASLMQEKADKKKKVGVLMVLNETPLPELCFCISDKFGHSTAV